MTVSIADIRHAIEIMLIEIYPDISALGEGCYSLNDILDQLIFELIKEEYKHSFQKQSGAQRFF